MTTKSAICVFLMIVSGLLSTTTYAQDGLGQTIQIQTRFQSFVGRPTWLLTIRDVDHNQVIPYVYEITRGNNYWVAFTYGRNYLITISKMNFSPYRRDPYRSKYITNFCKLESGGRIVRGESMMIYISGDLSPNSNSFNCAITRYKDPNFTMVNTQETP